MDDEKKARRRAYDREWRAKNADKVQAANKKWAATPAGKAKRKEIDKRWRENNPERRAQFTKEYHAANREKILERNKWYKIKRQFGLTRQDYEELLASQGSRCACCRTDDPNSRGGKGWVVDHCHATGRVRGLLCSHCNTALGLAGDDPAILEAMINYLRR